MGKSSEVKGMALENAAQSGDDCVGRRCSMTSRNADAHLNIEAN